MELNFYSEMFFIVYILKQFLFLLAKLELSYSGQLVVGKLFFVALDIN